VPEVRLVPDVQGQPLPAAQQAIAQAGLRAVADVSGAGVALGEREVMSQTPTPGTPADRGSEVRLQTVAIVAVPDLKDRTCVDAQREVAARGLLLKCTLVNAGSFTWTAPVIESQDTPAGERVRAGWLITAQARAPTPWLALMLGGSAALALAALAWKPVMARLRPGKMVAPPTAPALGLRGEPDLTPTLAVRVRDEALAPPHLGLRVEGGGEHLFVRGLDRSDGGSDGSSGD
jgi:hypothetical protein